MQAPLVKFHVDQPDSWMLDSRCVIIRGWCFAVDAGSIRAIRLLSGDAVLSGVTGLPRPDVKAALPEAPGDNTGFEIRGIVPAGEIEVSFQVQLDGGDWHPVLQRRAHVSRRKLPLWLGGGHDAELLFFQMPGQGQHPPQAIRPEKFPTPAVRDRPRPKLSLVTPSYGQARFLGETIQSVLDQQPDVACDYVVQDGGSSDGSADIIKRRANRLLAYEITPDNGQADAIAKGFAKTTGVPDNVMAWINSDDFYLPGALGFVADYFARHPDVDVIYGHRIVVDENSQEIARWFLPKHDPEVLRLNDFVPQETMFWRRRVWDQVGGIDPSFKFAMDWDLLLRFQAAGAKIVRVPYFLACFRVHAAQKTSAQMHSTGQQEITRLRERTFGRAFPPQELEAKPVLLRYLRRSAFIEFLWQLGWRTS